MSAALLGLLSAGGLGTADFMARFSTRALGAPLNYAGVLTVGVVISTGAFFLGGENFIWSPVGIALACAHGVSVALMCLMLYAGLARGPVSVVAPIVAAHPALVLVVNVAVGVRPSLAQWAAMAVVIVGGVLIALNAGSHAQHAPGGRRQLQVTLLIALGACLAYVMLVLTGQAATRWIGDMQTLFIARWSGLAFLVVILLSSRSEVRIPRPWWAFVLAQGILDTVGYIAFLAGAVTDAPHVAMVVASAFSLFTVLLARMILAEPISPLQWFAIALIAGGTAVLAGAG
jgi:drug/metabolite transporter (DMT)-like permease